MYYINIIFPIKNIIFLVGGTQHASITDSIAYFLCKDNKAFSTVEGEGFKNMVHKLNPLYKVPCRNTIKTYIDAKYTIVESKFRDVLKTISYFSLTTDIWTDTQHMKSFLGITIHFIQSLSLKSGVYCNFCTKKLYFNLL